MRIRTTQDSNRTPWAVAGMLGLLAFPCLRAYADDTSAATLAFRPALERAHGADRASEAPGRDTPVSATLAFRPAGEQSARELVGSESPTTTATAADYAFRPRGMETMVAPEAAGSNSIAYRLPAGFLSK